MGRLPDFSKRQVEVPGEWPDGGAIWWGRNDQRHGGEIYVGVDAGGDMVSLRIPRDCHVKVARLLRQVADRLDPAPDPKDRLGKPGRRGAFAQSFGGADSSLSLCEGCGAVVGRESPAPFRHPVLCEDCGAQRTDDGKPPCPAHCPYRHNLDGWCPDHAPHPGQDGGG